MTTDKGIFIQNIYYMLSYAYQVLQQQDYQCIASEKFEHIDDLFAAILAKGVSRQLKRQSAVNDESWPFAYENGVLTLEAELGVNDVYFFEIR